jgi:hypothetical protein
VVAVAAVLITRLSLQVKRYYLPVVAVVAVG